LLKLADREREKYEFLDQASIDTVVNFIPQKSDISQVIYGRPASELDDFIPMIDESDNEEEEDAWKDLYYREKFKLGIDDEDFVHKICKSYAEGLVWILRYYQHGCISWDWFYPYHYPPLISGCSFFSLFSFFFDLFSSVN